MSRYAFLRHQDVDSIPDQGAIVVTATRYTAKVLKEGIRDIRGVDVLKRCRFVSINRCGDEDKLMGLVGHVVFAHCFRLNAPPELLARVAEVAVSVVAWRRCRAEGRAR